MLLVGFQGLIGQPATDVEARAGHAHCLMVLGKLDEAAVKWEEVVKLAPDNKGHLQALGDTYNQIGVRLTSEKKFKEALEIHNKARDVRLLLLATDPDNPEFLATLGQTLNNIAAIMGRQPGRNGWNGW